jgi:hypothetical protein
MDEFVLGLKSVSNCAILPHWESVVRTLANCPRGRFAWTNHINFQITQPGSSTVTPLYQLPTEYFLFAFAEKKAEDHPMENTELGF